MESHKIWVLLSHLETLRVLTPLLTTHFYKVYHLNTQPDIVLCFNDKMTVSKCKCHWSKLIYCEKKDLKMTQNNKK